MFDRQSMLSFFKWAEIEKDGLIEYREIDLNTQNVITQFYTKEPQAIINSVVSNTKNVFHIIGANPRSEEGKNKDKDIKIFKNIYLDIEPIHEKNSICTYKQVEDCAKFIEWFLPKCKVPPIVAFSGNGYHLWWAIPNYGSPMELYDKLKLWYGLLLNRTRGKVTEFNIRIDQTLSPSRQVKLYGTKKPIEGAKISTFPFIERKESQEFLDYILSFDLPKIQASVGAIEEVIPSGQRNNTLVSLAGSMRHRGMTEEEIFESLKIVNRKRCNPPLEEKELEAISQSIGKYAPERPPEIINNDPILFSYASLQNHKFPEIELIPIGIPCLDNYFSGGLGKKEVSMFIAPQETGKTTLACAIGANAALSNRTILHIFYEDEPKVIKERYDSLNKNNSKLNVFFVDSTKRAIWLDKIEGYIKQTKPELVIVDYFARIPGVSHDRFKSKEALEWFGNIARQNNCHILILDHVTIINNPNDTSYVMRDYRVSESKMYKLAIVNYMVGFMKDRHNDDIIYLTGMKAKRKAQKLFKTLQVNRETCIFTEI